MINYCPWKESGGAHHFSSYKHISALHVGVSLVIWISKMCNSMQLHSSGSSECKSATNCIVKYSAFII